MFIDNQLDLFEKPETEKGKIDEGDIKPQEVVDEDELDPVEAAEKAEYDTKEANRIALKLKEEEERRKEEERKLKEEEEKKLKEQEEKAKKDELFGDPWEDLGNKRK